LPVYISLGKYTTEGITKIKDQPQRLKEVKKIMDQDGVSMKAFYFTFGQYDLVVIVEGPDDDTVLKCLLRISSRGIVTLETLKAFPEEKVAEIIKSLP
jgi:uncharacterized protein with GYD domain